MVLTLTREKMQMLFDMVEYYLKALPASNELEALVDEQIISIKDKMTAELATMNFRNYYRLWFTKDEALAFDTWMKEINNTVEPLEYYQERILSTQITNQIDETYGTIGIRKITGAIATAN